MSFCITPLSPELTKAMRETSVWKETSPIQPERLTSVHTKYFDFEGNEHTDGEIIVMDACAHRVLAVFRTLHAERFPVAKMRSVHHYNANDEASMADNNSSCFCDRPIENTTLTSLHSYGLAIDLNPVQNPFICFEEAEGTATILPPQGWEYLNRSNKKPGMIEDVVQLFAEHGFFVWGGKWTTPIDYHHVQTPRGVAELLSIMSLPDGKRFFDLCAVNRASLLKMPFGEKLQPLVMAYKQDSEKFLESFVDYLPFENHP